MPQLLERLGGIVEQGEGEKFDRLVAESIQRRRKPSLPQAEERHAVAFVSYRFSIEEYMALIKANCALRNIKVTTGREPGLVPPGMTVGNLVRRKIAEADFYIAVFLNDNSESSWLIEEQACAIAFEKPMLIFVEEGTPQHKIGNLENIPYHSFTKETFALVIAEQLQYVGAILHA